MNDVEKAIQTQLKNIETRSGKSLDELGAMVRRSGLEKHGEIRDMLKRDVGLGHGDANTLTHYVLQSRGAGAGVPVCGTYRSRNSTREPSLRCGRSTTS